MIIVLHQTATPLTLHDCIILQLSEPLYTCSINIAIRDCMYTLYCIIQLSGVPQYQELLSRYATIKGMEVTYTDIPCYRKEYNHTYYSSSVSITGHETVTSTLSYLSPEHSREDAARIAYQTFIATGEATGNTPPPYFCYDSYFCFPALAAPKSLPYKRESSLGSTSSSAPSKEWAILYA